MATPVVQSVASNTATSSTTVTITKPSGTVDGDLLVAFVGSYDAGGTTTPADESGWTTITNANSGNTAIKAYYKIAASEGANYTFDRTPSKTHLWGIIYRIDGNDGNQPDSSAANSTSTTATPSLTISLSPFVDNALLLLGVVTGDLSDAAATISSSGYSISGTNPTWTERTNYDPGGVTTLMASASATGNSNSTITSLGWDVGGGGGHTGSAHSGILLGVRGIENKSTSPSIVAMDSSVLAPTLGTNTTVSQDARVGMTSTLQAPTVSTNTPSWTTVTKS